MARTIALTLTIFTGFTGLVYQVTWQKYLATLLGSHSEATAAVLGIFLGGLSVGYSLFGVVTSRLAARVAGTARPSRLLLVYGAIEGSIGAYALVFPVLFRAAQAVSFMLPHENPVLGFFFDVVLSALLIGPPAVMMGATIPILTQALSRSLDDATRFHAFVYGLNTIGAFVGALAAGFYLVPRIGLDGSLLAVGVINLVAGAGYAALDLWKREAPLVDLSAEVGTTDAAEGDAVADPVRGAFAYLAAALLIGFAMMALETILIRVAGLAFGSSQFTFSMVVAAFVLCIAVGGLAVSGLARSPRIHLAIVVWSLAAFLLALYVVLPQAPYWVYVLRSAFSDNDAAFYAYYSGGFAMLLLAIGIPVVLSGMTLPLIFHHLRSEYGELGSLAGRLYSWNTVGSLLGALVGGYGLYFWFDLHHVYRVAVAAVVVAAVVLTVRLLSLRASAFAAGVPLLLGLAILPAWDPVMLQLGLYRKNPYPADLYEGFANYYEKHVETIPYRLLTYEDDPTASVAVRTFERPGMSISRSIVVNGKSDGNTVYDYETMALVSVLPSMMADSIERSFVIGWGTGVTVGELGSLEGTEEIIVAEISSGVVASTPHFEQYNLRAASNPKVSFVRSDAYRALTRSEQDFNLIISEPSNPWVTGVEMLFSREFLTLAKSKLAPGGIYAQWYHKYETDDASLALVLRTFASVFDHVSIWEATPNDLMILGFSTIGPAVDYLRMMERSERPDIAAALGRIEINSIPELFVKEFLPVGAWHAAAFDGPLHTLYRPILSDIAGRGFFRQGFAQLPFVGFGDAAAAGEKNAMLRRYIRFRGGSLDDAERLAAIRSATFQSRGFGVTLLADWMNEQPESEAYSQAYELAVDWLRRERPNEDAREVIEQLASLFGDSPYAPDLTTPQSAWQMTRLYHDFYFHAAPFDPAALEHAWQSCREVAKPREQCELDVAEGTPLSIELRKQGAGAVDAYLDRCAERRFAGETCRSGLTVGRRLLAGEEPGLPFPGATPL